MTTARGLRLQIGPMGFTYWVSGQGPFGFLVAPEQMLGDRRSRLMHRLQALGYDVEPVGGHSDALRVSAVPAKRNTQQRLEWLALCEELPRIEARLRACGLHATAIELNKATQRIGFEVAELRAKEGIA